MQSEQLPNQEIYTAPELDDTSNVEIPKNKELEKPSKNENLIDINEARVKVLEQPTVRLALPVDDSTDGDQPQYIDRAMKSISLKNELSSIRQKLPFDQKLLSQAIHRPIVKKTSEIASKTITRPVGLLGGGIFAFFGSLVYLSFTKYAGVKYNYLIFLMLFVLGYIVASMLELISKSFVKNKQ